MFFRLLQEDDENNELTTGIKKKKKREMRNFEKLHNDKQKVTIENTKQYCLLLYWSHLLVMASRHV